MERHATTTDEPPSLLWLAVGALAGLAAAGYGLLEQSGSESGLPPGAVARVNDALIDSRQVEGAIMQLARTTTDEVTTTAKADVLQRLIDEELLLQRGIDLGMVTSELTVRTAIVESLIASVTAEADAADPDDADLEAFMQDNADRYTYASAIRVEAWTTDDESLARRFVQQLESNSESATAELVPVPGLPTAPAPLERLRMFLGPAIAAADIPAGNSAVFARQGRWYVVRVLEHAEATLASLDSIRSQVLLDYRRSLAAERLQAYLEELRRTADIVVEL